jgi:hypothetical protein
VKAGNCSTSAKSSRTKGKSIPFDSTKLDGMELAGNSSPGGGEPD